jgi:hypothetical protein
LALSLTDVLALLRALLSTTLRRIQGRSSGW